MVTPGPHVVRAAKTHDSSATAPARAVALGPILAGRSRMGGGKRSNSPLVDAAGQSDRASGRVRTTRSFQLHILVVHRSESRA